MQEKTSDTKREASRDTIPILHRQRGKKSQAKGSLRRRREDERHKMHG